MSRWGIIGGGMLGLGVARRLARAGHEVAVFESASELGGLAAAWQLGNVVWDRHYHVILPGDASLIELLRELDLERDLKWTETRTGVYVDGRMLGMSNVVEFLSFPALSLLDKARLAATILRASRARAERLDDVLVAPWLRRWSGARCYERFWAPLLRAKLGSAAERASAAFICATITRLYGARRGRGRTESFGTVRGGYARILERLAESLVRAGVRLETGRPAASIERCTGGRLRIAFMDGAEEMFDRVVVTLAAPLVARLCPGLSEDERRRFADVEYLGIVCASLLLTRPASPNYITNILDPGFPMTGVIEMSALAGREALGGRSLVYLPMYAPADDAVFSRDEGELEGELVAGFFRMFPHLRPEDVVASRLSRAKFVFPVPGLGYARRVPPIETSIPGLFAAGTAQMADGILSVDRTLKLADRLFVKATGA